MTIQNVIKYVRSINGKTFGPGMCCNIMLINILLLLYPNHKNNKIIDQIKKQHTNYKSISDFRKFMKTHGTVKISNFLEPYGYKIIEDNRILPGDILIKSRAYFEDIIYTIDCNTYCGIAYNNISGQHKFRIGNNLHISTKHKIYRRI